MSQFTVTIIDQPTIKAAGIKVQTSMAKAFEDCPKLWSEVFGPRMASFPADPAYPGQSFGVSVMITENDFDYWVVMPLAPGAAVPEGIEEFTVPGGLNACCAGVTLSVLSDVYSYIYMKWPGEQSDYVLDFSRPGIEAYRSDFCQTQLLDVLSPVKQA
ncbi:MAG: GyrI-like domain-containing protein [Planctomycetaceae bacterium]|nr:GyrI-like domain-containing protein [Planctomycetaceae bacterium]